MRIILTWSFKIIQRNKIICLISFLLMTNTILLSQSRIVEANRNVGIITTASERVIDFEVKNHTNKSFYILSMQKGYAFDYKLSTDQIAPDSAAWIRIQIKQSQPGKFKKEIPVYFSDRNEPETIVIQGEIDQSGATELFANCPDFQNKPPTVIQQETAFTLKVSIIDANNTEPIEGAKIILLQNGKPIHKLKTDEKGISESEIPPGICYFVVQKKNFELTEVASYVNFKNNFVQIPIHPEKVADVAVISRTENEEPSEERIIEVTKQIEETTVNSKKELKVELNSWLLERKEKEKEAQRNQYNDASSEIGKQYKKAKKEFDVKNEEKLIELPFTTEYFNSVNVVFVIDVSSSMRQYDRLSLMKYALLELTDMLRDDDQFGVVTFASNTDVLIPNQPIKKAENLEEQIGQLKASGMTAGGAGIKLGFKQARKNFISDGHNMVVIITDGGFNKNSGNYQKWIRKNKKKGVYFSVVGVKNNEKSRVNLMEAAELGDGEYLEIHNLSDAAQNLNLAIRKLSSLVSH